MPQVHDDEEVARLLFFPQMVDHSGGQLKQTVFPMDELLANKNKRGVSVDRCGMLKDYETLLHSKAHENANPEGGRHPYGYCLGKVKHIRSIKIEYDGAKQAFEIFSDPILDNNPSREWDHAHALIVRFSDIYTRGLLRGFRDRLIEVFSSSVKRF
ncbi:MAG: hypothetical protein OXF20_11990 [Gammaproteobacteria bacterium]|nr:hypothetical protein [Gammaproteobacteria bacterium]